MLPSKSRMDITSKQDVFHVVSLTGGRDSAATAVWLVKNRPRLYIFTYCITGVEMPETLEFLKDLEKVIGPITYIETPGFEKELIKKHYYFPGRRRLWCEDVLRIRPVNKFIGRKPHVLYLGYTIFNRPKHYDRKRLHRIYSYPLIEHKVVSSQDLLNQYGLCNKVYDIMPHQNCWCCFQNSFQVMCKIFKQHPEWRRKFFLWWSHAQKIWGKQFEGYNYFLWKRHTLKDLYQKLGKV